MPKATRLGHEHECPSTDPRPHRGGPVTTPVSRNVETNREGQARAGDRLTCKGAPGDALSQWQDFIVTGSSKVTINGKLAAREGDRTMHGPGRIAQGSSNVEIGGPTAGAVLGAPDAAREACRSAAAGRSPPQGATDPAGRQLQPNTPGQSYNNCGLESSRQLINAADPSANLTQEQLLDQAASANLAERVPGNLYESGRTTPQNLAALLGRNNVPAQVAPNTGQAANMTQIAQFVAEGRGVIAPVYAAMLWDDSVAWNSGLVPGTYTGSHYVLVTGVEYDEAGELKSVIINDTGLGQCGQSVPASKFHRSLHSHSGNGPVVTTGAVWPRR
ncbi:MAG: PAAR domain-containing protein [Polyangiaceae bacterium]|nr:PAAR domain-containing protein [Polyangiaceae bacterium]